MMDSEIKGVKFEKDEHGNNRYIRVDIERYAEELKPLFQKIGINNKPEGWDESLSSEEFLTEAKKLLRNKFDERN